MAELLSAAEIAQRLEKLNQGQLSGWQVEGKKLYKNFVFSDFISAFGWMSKIAIHAEKMDHHPEWFNVYSRVKVELTTHDSGGITALDFDLARIMESLGEK